MLLGGSASNRNSFPFFYYFFLTFCFKSFVYVKLCHFVFIYFFLGGEPFHSPLLYILKELYDLMCKISFADVNNDFHLINPVGMKYHSIRNFRRKFFLLPNKKGHNNRAQ